MARDPFEQIVGEEYCSRPENETLDDVPVGLVVCPGTAQEVAACLAQAREDGRALVPSGGCSKLSWGNRTQAAALVRLDLGRLSEKIDLQAEEGIVIAQAGVSVERLTRVAAEHGKRTLLCTLYPGASVGGTIAADPPSLDFAADWRLRNEILGLEVAHPQGGLARCGGRVVKNVTGFDLVRLYCGSFGTLGVITEATLRLRPLPAMQQVLCRDFESPEAAITAAREILPFEPRAMLLRPAGPATRLCWTLEGEQDDVAQRARQTQGRAVEAVAWELLRAEAAGLAIAPEGCMRVRVAGRVSDVLAIWKELRECAGEASLRMALPLMGSVVAEVPAVALEPIYARARERYWAVHVERATPEQKAELDVFGPAPEALPLMRALKRRFDPERVLSPGRFVGGI